MNTINEQTVSSALLKDLLGLKRKPELEKEVPPFDKVKHENESRLKITQLFLWAYFILIAGSFLFSFGYNAWVAWANNHFEAQVLYLDVSNTVSLITTTLSSGVGFVIGYYFKNKDG